MARPIDRIQAKVDRAKKHIEDFQTALQEFFNTQPCAFAIREDPKARRRSYYVTRLEPVPIKLEAVAADAVGNLRESLDHLAYQIELAACGAPPQQKVYFPVGRNAENYLGNRRRYMKCARQAAVDALDAAEPYVGGKGEAIWRLNELQKTEKHHLLVPTTAMFGTLDIGVITRQLWAASPDMRDWARTVEFPSAKFRAATPQILKLGDDFFSEPLDPKLIDESPFTFEISFDRPDIVSPESALKTLQDFAHLVDGLVATFAPLLTE